MVVGPVSTTAPKLFRATQKKGVYRGFAGANSRIHRWFGIPHGMH